MSLSGVLAPAVAMGVDASRGINVDESRLVYAIVDIFQENALWAYLLLLVGTLYGLFLARKGESAVWKTIQVQLDTLQKTAFPGHQSDINDNHRVTLFKYKKVSWSTLKEPKKMFKERSWPWTGWLIPMVRSGHTGKETKARFWAPDAGQKAEGLAGKCWSSDTSIFEENLPSIRSESNDGNKRKYCRRTNMALNAVEGYCQSRRPLARSILTFPIKNGKGDRWGVLVFDSMDANGVDREKAVEAFRILIEPVGVLLEGV